MLFRSTLADYESNDDEEDGKQDNSSTTSKYGSHYHKLANCEEKAIDDDILMTYPVKRHSQ